VQVLIDTSVWSLALRRSGEQISEGEKKITATFVTLFKTHEPGL
jgi:hypothetical protein